VTIESKAPLCQHVSTEQAEVFLSLGETCAWNSVKCHKPQNSKVALSFFTTPPNNFATHRDVRLFVYVWDIASRQSRQKDKKQYCSLI